MRLAPLLAVAAFAASAVPAQAAKILPKCTTNLVHAAAGTSASCSTDGPDDLGNCCVAVYRTITVEVAEGALDATLTCSYGEPVTVHVAGLVPVQFSRWGGNDCTLRLVATETTTSAVATSTFSFVSTQNPR